MTVISEGEAEPLRSAITRKEAWTQDSARRLRAEAERRVNFGPWSVTLERPSGILLDLHDYYSEPPYWWPNPDDPSGPYILREGHINPDRFTANRAALNTMCETVFTLGAAAYLFDDMRYAQRAERIVNTWFVNPKTRMNPNLDYAGTIHGTGSGRPAGIVEGRALIRAIQGMEFLMEEGNWDPKDQAAVKKWFEDYLHWLMQSKNGVDEKNSPTYHGSWWAAQVAVVASFVEDSSAEKTAFDLYREKIFPRQFRTDANAPHDDARAATPESVLNLEALTVLCRIAEAQAVDLWSMRAKNGSSLGTAIDSLLPYLSDPRRWTKEGPEVGESIYFLAFAGIGLKKPEYIALYEKLEPPERAWLNVVDLLVGRWEAAGHQTRHE
jgi:alginate lyase